jgi:methionine sulfoxide reductase heme-binding subunit
MIKNRRLVLWASILLYALYTIILLLQNGISYDSIIHTIRLTSKVSLVLFAIIFISSPLQKVWRSKVSQWLMIYRRELGISFGITFLTSHIGLIGWLFVLDSNRIWDRIQIIDIFGGGAGLALLLAMLLTSFKKFSTGLAPKTWQRIHLFGLFYVWGIFIFDQFEKYYLVTPPPAGPLFYFPFMAILISAMGLRLISLSGKFR